LTNKVVYCGVKAIVRLAGTEVDLSICRLLVGPKSVPNFGQWAAAIGAVLPTVNAGQYATSN